MPINADQLVRHFGQAVESRNSALFAGAGLSTDAGAPGWGELLGNLRAQAGVPSTLDDLPLVAQYIVENQPGGRATLESSILKSLKSATSPGLGHETIARMPLDEIWTTNYDCLLEGAMPDARVVTSDDDLLDRTTHASRRLIKMHGSVSKDGSSWEAPPVITRGDYEAYQGKNMRMWSALQATYLTRSTLFVGFSFSDPNIDILLRLSRTMPQKSSHAEHFTVLRRPTEETAAKLHNLRVNDLEHSGVAVCEIEDYRDLTPLLQNLERRTRKKNLFVSGSLRKDDTNIKDIARRLGADMAQMDISIVSLAGAAATEMSFALGEELIATDRYDPSRLQYYFREKKDSQTPYMHKRIGTAIYSGLQKEELRQSVMKKARAALVIGGGTGTLAEIEMCLEDLLPVIPLACTGGTAKLCWEKYTPEGANLPSDDRACKDWALLDSDDAGTAVLAAGRLIRRAMYLKEQSTVGGL
ncbi:SIR2 family protein [Ornithinimicrobium sp. Arc0846-15]|nr:SIR2 family protein [Ornithinimicrobium laminariae]